MEGEVDTEYITALVKRLLVRQKVIKNKNKIEIIDMKDEQITVVVFKKWRHIKPMKLIEINKTEKGWECVDGFLFEPKNAISDNTSEERCVQCDKYREWESSFIWYNEKEGGSTVQVTDGNRL